MVKSRKNKYPSYKPSGIDWLGDIPEHWGVKRLKYVSKCNTHSLPENTHPDLFFEYVDISSVSLERGIIEKQQLSFSEAPSRARRLVNYGDTIISTVRTYLKAIAYIDKENSDIIVSTGFAVIEPNEEVDSLYISYSLQNKNFIDSVVSRSVGVSYPAINSKELIHIPIPLPPLEEQKAIADYLDEKTGSIDALIERKEKLLALLDEKRTALITDAVTKGLNPKAKLKPSGIDWLGDIPEHWGVSKISYCFDVKLGKMLQPEPRSGDDLLLPYLRSANVYWTKIDLENVNEMYFSSSEIERYILKKNDLLISEGGDVGRSCIWQFDDEMYYQNALNRVREKKNPKSINIFLYYWLYFLKFNGFINIICNVSTLSHYTAEKVKATPLPLPPLEEQKAIAGYLDGETKKIDEMKEKITAGIEKLQEYRAALITAAVTGKIDIRN